MNGAIEFNSLTTTLSNFITAFQGGYSRLQPVINGLLGALAAIEIVLLGYWWALGGGEQLANVIKKILFLGFWLWLTTSFQGTSKAFVQSLIKAGLIAGGNPGGEGLLLDPSRIAGYGLKATEMLVRAIDNVGFDIVDGMIFGLGYVAIIVAFLIMAIQVFLAVLEYYLLTAVVGILIPFGILPQTKFLAEKAIGAIVSAGIKLMVLAFILAVTEPVLSNIHFAGPEVKFNEVWSVLLTCGGIAFLTWHAPSMAAGLLAGSPSLGAAAAAQNLGAGTMLATGIGGLMLRAASGAFGRGSKGGDSGSAGGGRSGPSSAGALGGTLGTVSSGLGGGPPAARPGKGSGRPQQGTSERAASGGGGAGPSTPPSWAAAAKNRLDRDG